jgi:DNA (cytosine-5)-methyltransferase 1
MSAPIAKNAYGVKLVRGPFVRLPPHPDACSDEQQLLALAKASQRPLAADLFCGAGGLSLGLQQAGFQVVLGVDNDREALETHRALCPGLSVDWDLGDEAVVTRVAALIRRAGITLVAGGPPCQPFSKAGRSMIRDLVRTGRRERHDHRRNLWQSFLAVAARARPPAVLMENVPDMALDRDMLILRTMVDELEALGYSVEERVIDTWRHGVPQFRQRLILVALRDGFRFRWPEERPDRVTVDNAIGDLPPVEGGWRPDGGADGWARYEGPRTTFQRAARDGVPAERADRVYDHITRPVREDDAVAFATMDSTTRYSELDPGLRRYRHDIFDDKYKRLDPHALSRSITAHIAKDGYWYIHPYQDRTLTVREAARIQTFPDRVRFAGPPSAAFRQIGNAVPPLLARRVGEAVLAALERREARPPSTFEVASRLAGWFQQAAGRRALPWLWATTRWQVVQAELLLNRARADVVRSIWPLLEPWTTPEATLAHAGQLREIGAWIDRGGRVDQLLAAATWFAEEPDRLGTAASIAAAPHVPAWVADLAVRVVPGPDEDPVLASYGVLRVAARFTGEPVDQANKLSDGRLAVARMIGVDEVSNHAHLGLIELAGSLCRAGDAPLCGDCPLNRSCVEELTHGWSRSRLF